MKRTPLDERPDWLPEGWHMLFRQRKDGKTDRYFMSPSTGHKCFSKSQVMDRIAIEMDDEDDAQIVEQPDGQPTRTRSGRAIRRPSKDIRRRHQPTVEIGDSPEWLPSGWILEIRTSQGPGGMKYKRYVDTSTDSSFSSKKAVLRYLQSEELGSPSLIKERSTSTNSAADIHTSSNQSGSIESTPANNNLGIMDTHGMNAIEDHIGQSTVGLSSPLDIEPCSSRKSTKAVWSTKNENIFIDILIQHVNMGSLPKSSFTTEICSMIFAEFIKRTKKSYDSSQIRIKYFGLKKRYKNFKRLIEHDGFCWDSTTDNVTANKEVWDEYVKANPWAKTFRTNGCPEYSRLCIIFGETTTGQGGLGTSGAHSNHIDSTSDHEDSLSETEVSPSPTSENGAELTQTHPSARRRRKSRSLLDLTLVDSATPPFSKAAKKAPDASPSATNEITPSAGRQRKSGSMMDSVTEAMLADAPGFTKVTKKTPTTSPFTSTPGSGNPFSMTNCMSELKKIKEISMPVQLKAISALTIEVWREAFMNMDDGLKKAWLKSLEPDLRSSKTGPICHDEGICSPPATKVAFNETEHPSQEKALDVLYETIPDSGGCKRARGRKKSGSEELVDSHKQASAAQSQLRKTKSSKANAVAVRTSERLSGIKASEPVDTQKQGSPITSSEQQARTKPDHADDSEISDLPCQATDNKREQLPVEEGGDLSSGDRSIENQKQGSAAKLLPRRTKSFKASTPPSRSSRRLVGIKAVYDVEITDRLRETMVSNSEQRPVLGSGQSLGESDEPETVPTIDIDYILGKIEAEKLPVAGETKLSCEMSGFPLANLSPKLFAEIKSVHAVDSEISDTPVSKSEQLPLAPELGSIQSCVKSDDREAASTVDIAFIEKIEVEKPPVFGETKLNCGGLVNMEAVHALDSGTSDHHRETMVSKSEHTAVPAMGSVRNYGKTDELEIEVGVSEQLPLMPMLDTSVDVPEAMSTIDGEKLEAEKPPDVEERELGFDMPDSLLILPPSPMVFHTVDSGISDRPAETMVSMSVDSGISDRPTETVVSRSPKTVHAVDPGISNRPAETMVSMPVDSGISDRPAETIGSMLDQPRSPKTVLAVDSGISNRPVETTVSISVAVDSGIICDRPTEVMISMSADSVITDQPVETMVGTSDQLPVIPVSGSLESSVKSDEPEAASLEVEERKPNINSSDSLLNKPFGASWPDPCLEFAFKTLTTDIIAVPQPHDTETPCKVSFNQKEIFVEEEVPVIWGAGCSAEGKATRSEGSGIPDFEDGSCK